MNEIKSIVLVDDHPIFRRGLAEVIAEYPQYKVVSEAGDGKEALDAIQLHHPEFVILDISMPRMDGFEVLIKAGNWADPPTFIMLTMYDDEAYLKKSLEYGAMGYLLKDNAEQEIINCLERVGKGKPYISASVSWQLTKPAEALAVSDLDKLSPAEHKVFSLVSDFKTSGEIADLLSVSIRTVENHRAHICKKLGLKGSHALTQYVAKIKSAESTNQTMRRSDFNEEL